MVRKVEEIWQILVRSVGVARVRQLRGWIPELVEEWMHHGVNCRQALCRRVLEQLRNQVDRIWVGLTEHLHQRQFRVFFLMHICRHYLAEWMRLDLWKLMLHVVRIHSANLVASRSTKHLDYLHQLVDARLSWEERLTEHELCHDATSGPDIYESSVGARPTW